uniref:Uncharacterized protein n=1 Tax=Arundo donax TaxID=35708 RepID=A0A0A8YZG0_ARUDO
MENYLLTQYHITSWTKSNFGFSTLAAV